MAGSQETWDFTAKAQTKCIVLSLSREAFDELAGQSEELRDHLAGLRDQERPAQNRHGEAAIALASGHAGEPVLPGTFVDY
ncbi:Crp/Fnr family transcriptional regulator, partial [Actinoallomurus acaciae]